MSIGCFGNSKEDQWKLNKLTQEVEIPDVECPYCGDVTDGLLECDECGIELCMNCSIEHPDIVGDFCISCAIKIEKEMLLEE